MSATDVLAPGRRRMAAVPPSGGNAASAVRITGGEVLAPDGFARRDLCLADGAIVADAPGAAEIDARGLLVLPGIVDVHGDAFERQLMPRPGVGFDAGLALLETDRQMVANGITTAYHGLTVSWEPGLRSLDAARAFVASLRAVRPRLSAETLLHIRWETFAAEAMEDVAGWLQDEAHAILAFNDHLTPLIDGGFMARKIDKAATRAGLGTDAYRALADGLWARRAAVEDDVLAMARRALAAGAVLLAHDETSPAMRARYRALGACACEFPMTPDTARDARAAGEHVVLGAPNVLRGGSHNGAIAAAEAVLADECTVLASDYYHPAPLLAPFVLARRHGVPLERAWALVSEHPAEMAGLADRGRLEPGRRADVILVDPAGDWPEVRGVWVAGRPVLRRG
jgi:alpha-D-ribose 1-methylphosphonate 5-triphosphate diphosphatase